MHFSKIYIQENFVPNVVQDPFGRKVIGTEVFLNQDDDIEKGRELAEQYIKEYIQRNTVYPDHDHIEEKVVQVERTTSRSLEDIIGSCTELEGEDGLLSYRKISEMNPKLNQAYHKRFQELINSLI